MHQYVKLRESEGGIVMIALIKYRDLLLKIGPANVGPARQFYVYDVYRNNDISTLNRNIQLGDAIQMWERLTM